MSLRPGRLRDLKRRAVQAALRVGAAHRPRGVILAYHRVAVPRSDPWNLSVAPGTFAAQMDLLASSGCVTSLGGLLGNVRGGGGRRHPLIAITFDDAYACTLHRALPVLERAGLPATVFATSGAIGDPAAFWWDLLDRVFLETPVLPDELRLDCGGRTERWTLGAGAAPGAEALARDRAWKADTEEPSSVRQRTHLSVWTFVSGLPAAARGEAAARIAEWAGLAPEARTDDLARPVTEGELAGMAARPGVEIGGHSVSHCDFSRTGAADAEREIVEDRRRLAALTGRAPRHFAFPYGRVTPEAEGFVRAAGYEAACSSRLGVVTSSAPPFRLPRMQVIDGPVEDFARDLRFLLGRLAGPEANRPRPASLREAV